MNGDPVQPGDGDGLQGEVDRLRLLHSISQEFSSSLDFDELLPKVFNSVLDAVGAQGGSIWIAEGEILRCRLALGAASQKLVGSEVPIGEGFVGDVARKQRSTIVSDAMQDPRFQDRVDRSSTMITTGVLVAPMVVRGQTVGSIQVTNKVTGAGIFEEGDRLLLEGLARSAAVALRNAQLHTAEKRARDLAMLLEISREVTSTLDLDRILTSVVNLATRALDFEIGSIGLVDRAKCEIRAIAGKDEIDPKDEGVRRLQDRASWVLGRGEAFYLADREAVSTDDERAFVNALGEGLATDEIRSGLYLPLVDEEGALGVLLFEAKRPAFASDTQREMVAILANQTAVALRNAELYNQVPLVDMLGALAEKKKKLLALPRRRVAVYAVTALVALAALTLIRWPFRVTGAASTFRAATYSEARPVVSGVIERILVREGQAVSRGDPLVQLRAVTLRADREAADASLQIAERAAAAAAARNDATAERIQRTRVTSLSRQLALLDEEIAVTTVRAPVDGVVLTARPEELVGARPNAGDPLLTLGRTDSLELELGVRQRDIDRVEVGQRIRLRVDALPQRTFEGNVTFVAPLPVETTKGVYFFVRGLVPNDEGVLRPGMAAYAKVLTASTSVLGRILRAPTRWARLLWWRLIP